VTLDPLGVVTKTRTSAEDTDGEDGDCLAAAASTVHQSKEMPQLAAESHTYSPGLGAVPEVLLPDSLRNVSSL